MLAASGFKRILLNAFAHDTNWRKGKTSIGLFEQSGKPQQQVSAVRHLQAALEHWKKYAAVATSQYKPQMLGRVGPLDLQRTTADVEADVVLARDWKQGTVKSNGEAKVPAPGNFKP